MIKKIFMTLLMAVTVFGLSAADLDQSQLNLRNNIFSFLQSEGYTPSIDNDGDIKFKYQGIISYVSVSSTDSSPYFVEVYQVFTRNAKYSKTVAELACHELNLYKGVKVYPVGEDGMKFTAQMYVRDAEPVKKVMLKLLRQLDSATDDLSEELSKAQSQHPNL